MTDLPIHKHDVAEAADRIARFVHRTPVLTSSRLNELTGASLFFKAENFQKIGAFKARGAHNAVFSLSDEEVRNGVVTHSSGNHAAALALAARNRGVPAYIVMPEDAPRAKIASVERQGGRITFCPPTLAAREAAAARLLEESGGVLLHPYDDWRIIAGQGTAALELLADVPDLDAIVAPVGGGGLLAGTCVAASDLSVSVYGAEPEGADDAARSFRSGVRVSSVTPNTICDGLRTLVGERPFEVIRRRVTDVITVSDEEAFHAMRLVWEILKIIIEPSCAVPVAALLARPASLQGRRVGIILSGGNVDLDRLPWQPKTSQTDR